MNFEVRNINEKDIEYGGFLEVLNVLAPLGNLSKPAAKKILNQILSNLLHRVFVAVIKGGGHDGLVIGTSTLFVEPKFIFEGGRVGHIEDVAVRIGYQGQGVGFELVKYATTAAASMGCVRSVLDCSTENMGFY